MRKLLKPQVLRNLLSTILFGVIYVFFHYVDKGTVEISLIVKSMVFYFLAMCFLYFLAPKLRKVTGHEEQ